MIGQGDGASAPLAARVHDDFRSHWSSCQGAPCSAQTRPGTGHTCDALRAARVLLRDGSDTGLHEIPSEGFRCPAGRGAAVWSGSTAK